MKTAKNILLIVRAFCRIAMQLCQFTVIRSRFGIIRTMYSLRASWFIGGFGWGLLLTFLILVLMR